MQKIMIIAVTELSGGSLKIFRLQGSETTGFGRIGLEPVVVRS